MCARSLCSPAGSELISGVEGVLSGSPCRMCPVKWIGAVVIITKVSFKTSYCLPIYHSSVFWFSLLFFPFFLFHMFPIFLRFHFLPSFLPFINCFVFIPFSNSICCLKVYSWFSSVLPYSFSLYITFFNFSISSLLPPVLCLLFLSLFIPLSLPFFLPRLWNRQEYVNLQSIFFSRSA